MSSLEQLQQEDINVANRHKNLFSNGRIDIIGELPANSQFEMYDKIPVRRITAETEYTSFVDALTGNWTETPLSKAFFSAQNIQIIQNGIRAAVYEITHRQHIIPPQNEDTLKIIMRSIFLEYSANMPRNITNQISALNDLVYKYAVPQICSEISAYIKYKTDASTLVMPMSHPVLATNKDKTLELKRFI